MRAILIIIIIFLLIMPTYAYLSELEPHENPEEAKSWIGPDALLFLYIQFFQSLINRDYTNATLLLKLLKAASIPENIKYLINRLNELMEKLSNELNVTETLVNEAERLADFEAYDEALKKLDEAKFHLSIANRTLNSIEEAVGEVLRRIPQLGPISSRLEEFKVKINELLKRIRDLIFEILQRIKSIEEEIMLAESEYEHLRAKNTYISVFINPKNVWVGDRLIVYGRLRDENGSGISNMNVIILIGNFNHVALTDDGGVYNKSIIFPFIYKRRLKVEVFFKPSTKEYKPSHNSTFVNVSYYETTVFISAPEIVYPGLKFEVNVVVEPWVEGMNREFKLMLDGSLLFMFNLNKSSITVPLKLDSLSIGVHIITVFVGSYWRYAPATNNTFVRASYKAVNLTLNISPKTVIYPLFKIKIKGNVIDSEGKPLSGEDIIISGVGIKEVAIKTARDGSFNVTIDPPNLMPGGKIALTIIFKPKELWYPTIERVITINIINIFFWTLALIIGASGSIWVSKAFLKLYRRIIRSEKAVIVRDVKKREPRREGRGEEFKFKMIGGEAVELYRTAVKIISNLIGWPKVSETIREYYRRASKALNDEALRAFYELSIAAEYELYSGRRLSRIKLARLENMLKILEASING